MALIEFENVSVCLHKREIIRDISFHVEKGQFVCLLGPNGAGKTTLVKALAGLLPYTGSIRINGQEVRDISPKTLGRQLAYIPQGHNVHWPMNVKDLVRLGRLPYYSMLNLHQAEDEDIINSALEASHLLDLADRRFDQLSGGEKSRVMIARSLASNPKIVLADEPTSALDPYHQLQIMDVLRNNTQRGLSLIAILHDISHAAQFSDKVLLLFEGNLVDIGHPEDVLSNDSLKKIFNIQLSQNIDLNRGIWKIDKSLINK